MAWAITQGEFSHPRQVALSYVSEYTVSTVLLTNGECFETLVFDAISREECCRETLSRAQAVYNHLAICESLSLDHMPKNEYLIRR